MEPSNPNKRSRADTVGNATTKTPDVSDGAAEISPHSEVDIDRWLKTLDPGQHQRLLRQAAILHSDVAGLLKSQSDEIVAKEAAKERTFNQYVRRAEYHLHERFKSLSDSKQYERSHDVETEIEAILREIADTVKEHHSWATKFNALEAIREILDDILDAYGVIGDEVRKGGWGWGARLVKVCRAFTKEDRKKLQEVKAGEDGTLWLDVLEVIASRSEDYNCGRPGSWDVDKALRILQGEDVREDED
ncbi:hypothetical protein V8F20_011451 [Naviculisporaceae sp. PSN 640]